MTTSEYQQKIVRLRRVTASTQAIAEQHILATLRQAYADLTELLALKKMDSLTYFNLASRRVEIGRLIDNMVREMSATIRLGIRAEAEGVTRAYEAVTRSSGDLYGVSFPIASYSWVPRAAIDNVTTRVWSDGRTFSDRVWRTGNQARSGINEILAAGVARGESAVDISKQIRQFLIEPEITAGTSWTTAVRPSVTGAGSIHYNALRLARTEINNSYRESLVLANEANPITLGVKWNLSGSHPTPDICDVWAESDLYGYGEGVYPGGAAPIDHPGGLCYMTEVLRNPAEWNREKEFRPMLRLSRAEIMRPIAESKPGVQNAAWKMFNSVNDMIQSERIAMRQAA